MTNVEFKNYCIIVLGEVEGAKDEVSAISQTEVKYMEGKGILIGTFCSPTTIMEINDFFKSYNRNFVLFELGDNNFGVNFNNQKIQKYLFGDYEKSGNILNDFLSNKLANQISGPPVKYDLKLSGDDINYFSMSKEERDKILNSILEKGHKNITEDDKKIIEKLSKYS